MDPRYDILCIGHFCHDVAEKGFLLGGTASYCSLVARQLGYKTAVLTSVGPDFLFADLFVEKGIDVKYVDAQETTVFHNVYESGLRSQHLSQRASLLKPSDLPFSWKQPRIVKFCSIAAEIDPEFLNLFPDTVKGATIQGWLREWDESGRVTPKAMDFNLLKGIDVVLMSRDDVNGLDGAIDKISEIVKILVVTDGREGAEVYDNMKKSHFPAFPVIEVDPTGAGDVFAVTFLTEYANHYDISRAVGMAHCAASFVVQGLGTRELGSRESIHERYLEYLHLFGQAR